MPCAWQNAQKRVNKFFQDKKGQVTKEKNRVLVDSGL